MSTPIATTQLDDENPWPGLEAFEENARAFFRGRDREAENLTKRVLDAPVTVLYGRSGLGKTSLLRAGLFPLLREHNFLPIYVRFDVKPDAAPLATQLRASITKAISDELPDAIPPDEHESVWEYLHRNDFELWNAWNYPLTPVLVLDQFEELFTLGERVPELVRNFRDDLGDLAENRIPADLAARIDADDSLTARFNLRSQNYKILVSLREDFLADLEGWRRLIPSLARSRMRLRRLQASEAFDAVYSPANTPSAQRMTAELAHRVVSIIAGEDVRRSDDKPQEDSAGDDAEVEPALLSLFCRELNEERKRRGQAIFDAQLVEDAKTDILSNYYLSCVRDLPPRVADFIESELITEKGFRNSFPRDDAVPAHLTDDELTGLIRLRLLRLEDRYGTQRIELTHDVLTGVIREQRDRRRAEEEKEALAAQAEKERQALAQAAAEREAELEKEKERQQAELEAAHKLAAAETEAKEEARELAELATKSKEEAQAHEAQLAQRTRVLRIAVAVSTIAALIAAGLGIVAHNNSHAAQQQSKLARQNFLDATVLKLSAQSQSESVNEWEGGEYHSLQEVLAASALADQANSADAKQAAAGALFDAAVSSRNLLKIFEPPESDVSWISVDQQHVVAVQYQTDSCSVRAWNFSDGQPAGPAITYSLKSSRSCLTTDIYADEIFTATGADDLVQRWKISTGQPVGEPIRTGQRMVTAVWLSPDGRQLYTGGNDGTVRVWNAENGQPIGESLKICKSVYGLGVSDNGDRFITWCEEDDSLSVRDTRTRELIGPTISISTKQPDNDSELNNAAISFDGSLVVTASDQVRVWNSRTGEEIITEQPMMFGDRSYPYGLSISSDNKSVVAGSTSGRLQRWDLTTGEPEGAEMKFGGDFPILSAYFDSRDKSRVYVSTSDGILRLVQQDSYRDLDANIHRATISDDGRIVAVAEYSGRHPDGMITLHNIAGGKPVVIEKPGHVHALAFSRDGRHLVSGAKDGTVRIWDVTTGKEVRASFNADSEVNAVAFSPDGRYVVTGGADRELKVWDTLTSEPSGDPMPQEGVVSSVVYSHNGKLIIAGDYDGKVRIWDATTRKAIGDPIQAESSEVGVTSLAISPDDRRIASGGGIAWLNGETGMVRIWDIETRQQTRQQNGKPTNHHTKSVFSVAFDSTGEWVLSGGEDGTARVWSSKTGDQIGNSIKTSSYGFALGAFTSAPQQLVIVDKYGGLQLSPGPGELIKLLCGKITTNMTETEWDRWVSPDIDYIRVCQNLP